MHIPQGLAGIQAIETGGQHQIDDLGVCMLAAHLEEFQHRVAGSRIQRVQDCNGRQLGVDAA